MNALLIIAVISSAILAGFILIGRPTLLPALWAFGLTFTAISVGAGLVMKHFLKMRG
jgi:hypothetical protein